MKRITLIISLLLVVVVGTKAQPARVPAVREPIEVMQPDSTLLTVLLHGDEWKHWRTTIDGFVVEQDDKGFYRYVVVTTKGEQRMGCRVAHNPADRSKCEQKYVSKKGVKR
ncbi:MAG: hypothetical protein SPI67_03950 [Paludibacteraceae bacterium]|nr:hypothetical protein [Paludibacteraceae bacterium]